MLFESTAPWANGVGKPDGMEAPMRAPWAKEPGQTSSVNKPMHAGAGPGAGPRGMGPPGAAAGPPSTFQWRGWTFNAPKGPILSTHDADK